MAQLTASPPIRERFLALRGTASRLALRKLDELTLDVSGLAFSQRALVVAGYCFTFAFLLGSLVAEIVPATQIRFAATYGSAQISLIAAAIVGASFVVGWAFVLTGASDSGKRLFIPLLGIWMLEVMLINPLMSVAVLLLSPGLVLLARSQSARRWPIAEFVSWIAVNITLIGTTMAFSNDAATLAGRLYEAQTVLALIGIGVWIWLGFDAVAAAVRLGRLVCRVGRGATSELLFRRVSAALTVTLPVLAVIAFTWDRSAVWLGWVWLIAAPVSIGCIVLLMARRWSTRAAALALSSQVVVLATTFTFTAAFQLGPVDWLIGGSAAVPATFLFVILAAYDVLALTTRLPDLEGRVVPRSGRVLLYFGAVLLFVGGLVELSSVRTEDSGTVLTVAQALSGMGLSVGMVVLGVPYLGFALLRRRDHLLTAAGEVSS